MRVNHGPFKSHQKKCPCFGATLWQVSAIFFRWAQHPYFVSVSQVLRFGILWYGASAMAINACFGKQYFNFSQYVNKYKGNIGVVMPRTYKNNIL